MLEVKMLKYFQIFYGFVKRDKNEDINIKDDNRLLDMLLEMGQHKYRSKFFVVGCPSW